MRTQQQRRIVLQQLAPVALSSAGLYVSFHRKATPMSARLCGHVLRDTNLNKIQPV